MAVTSISTRRELLSLVPDPELTFARDTDSRVILTDKVRLCDFWSGVSVGLGEPPAAEVPPPRGISYQRCGAGSMLVGVSFADWLVLLSGGWGVY